MVGSPVVGVDCEKRPTHWVSRFSSAEEDGKTTAQKQPV